MTAAQGAIVHAADSPGTPQQVTRINHDLHTHTIYSDGASSIPLHVLEARAFELDAVAITDHYTPGSKIYDHRLILTLPQRLSENDRPSRMIVLKGAEATAWMRRPHQHRCSACLPIGVGAV
jgi:hypothetical protein